MAEIIPFCGLRYNKDIVGDLSKVMTPPYDIISSVEQQQFYSMNDYNIIRLELGKENPGDNEKNNKYTRAAEYLENWIDEKVLVRDSLPSFYIYQQKFELSDGESHVRTGFIGLVRLEEFSKGNILPHENTLSKPKADRLELMRACGANFSQIFGLYDDPEKNLPGVLDEYIKQNQPVIEIEAIDGIIDKLWAVSEPSILRQIQDIMADKSLYIADGHHRYETALNYRNECISQNPNHKGHELYNFVMMTMVEMEDPGLIILPTHRVIKGKEGLDKTKFIQNVSKEFNIEEYAFSCTNNDGRIKEMDALLQKKGAQSFILYDGNGVNCTILTLKDLDTMKNYLPENHESYRNLDVCILHTLILEPFLGIGSTQLKNQDFLTYTHDIKEGITQVDDGTCQMVFLMNPTTVKQVKEVSLAGEKMPQKSTYFYPKLLTGLVLNKL
jgi:uncharacterized protein (DUF1015 family)